MTFREDMEAASAEIIDALGEAAVFTGDYGPLDIKAIFNPGATVTDDFTGNIRHETPYIEALASAIVKVTPHDTVTIGSVTYEIIQIDPGRPGTTRCTLNEIRDDA